MAKPIGYGAGNRFENATDGADLTGIPATGIGGGTVDNTEFGYLDGVTSPIQDQLNTLATDVALATSGGNTFYLQEIASDIAGYETLRTQPSTAAEDWDEKRSAPRPARF
jgi:hypothetical protein